MRIPVGQEDFREIRNNQSYYVDKTELICDLLNGTDNKVTLFTRPRRFGKTVMMSMLEYFFSIQKGNSRDLFEGLNISEHDNICSEWMNRWPVLFLTLKDVEGTDFGEAYEMLAEEISKLCIKNANLGEEKSVHPADVQTFHRLLFKKANKADLKNSLQTLMRMMHAVYRKPVILLIDEYDVPLAKAESAGDPDYYRQMLDLIRGLMSVSLKTNEYLKFAVITGCLRISKESIFTGVNNFTCYSVTSRKFSSYFGFTPEEVTRMLEACRMNHKMELIRQWYDGYIFGNSEVFCPWDVVNYLSHLLNDEEEKPRNFWANTSSNAILDEFVNHSRFDVSDKFEALLNGGTITEEISEELTYDHLADSEKNLWSVLLMTGYVSKADRAPVEDRIRIRIPNAEIAGIFRDAVMKRFERTLDNRMADAFVSALWNQDEETASQMLTDILWNSISYFDYGEEYYHGMLNGIFSAMGYVPDSNDEAGLGRLDLRVKDRRNRRVLIMEFKRVKAEKEMEIGCEEALSQIISLGYNRLLPDGYDQQLIYGISFFGKKARVKLGRDIVSD